MKKYIFISGIFLSLNVLADDHMATKKKYERKIYGKSKLSNEFQGL